MHPIAIIISLQKKGVKALFFYTMGGIQAYHDIYDHPKTLSLKKFDNVLNLMINYINYSQKDHLLI